MGKLSALDAWRLKESCLGRPEVTGMAHPRGLEPLTT
jgi:hypothetical protein